ncbi:hypothetical protein [Sporolactobacillus sp. THM19-2]|uniref:hypothetical protein n=1 Tax=Sporolactobacillus sp. THM19-2 TaxID=2511171 RepID=UPI00101F12EC|nr:hypothetical protein [Sporolactobacillus sp. THM19-2]RYL94718.1 hypothetical protein EWH91_01650 [Sporolactobacillus sp. THM19-2]
MRQSAIVTCAALLLVCIGFGWFYFTKIIPMKQEIAFTQQNVKMYQDEALARAKKENKDTVVHADRLPKQPEVESFFSDFQQLASRHQVAVATIAMTDSDDRQNNDPSSNVTGQSVLKQNRYMVTITAGKQSDIVAFLGDLEKMEHLHTLSHLSLQSSQDNHWQATFNLTLYSLAK